VSEAILSFSARTLQPEDPEVVGTLVVVEPRASNDVQHPILEEVEEEEKTCLWFAGGIKH